VIAAAYTNGFTETGGITGTLPEVHNLREDLDLM
jgi:hypothetical protein